MPRVLMTTQGVADLMNGILDPAWRPGQPGADSRKNIREEVLEGALIARVHENRGQWARIRIHVDDFVAWAASKVRPEQCPRVSTQVAAWVGAEATP
jgi:hypothetical protein